MPDDAPVNALARKLHSDPLEGEILARVILAMPEVRAYWMDEARGDARLVPGPSRRFLDYWTEKLREARAERDALAAENERLMKDATPIDGTSDYLAAAQAHSEAMMAATDDLEREMARGDMWRAKANHYAADAEQNAAVVRDLAAKLVAAEAERVRVVADLQEKAEALRPVFTMAPGSEWVRRKDVLDLLSE